jgi:hypothetical protein
MWEHISSSLGVKMFSPREDISSFSFSQSNSCRLLWTISLLSYHYAYNTLRNTLKVSDGCSPEKLIFNNKKMNEKVWVLVAGLRINQG